MTADPALLRSLLLALARGEETEALAFLADRPGLAREAVATGASRQDPKTWFVGAIGHYLYAGDTALHAACAGYRTDLARKLIALGAGVSARNRRGAEPLHYAAAGGPGAPSWNPAAQAATIALLIQAGADPNAVDKGGVTPLHRSVRNRCSAAVAALIEGGADVRKKNGSGSTAMMLAGLTTGRGGTGSPEAKAEQAQIVHILRDAGA